MLVLLEEEPEPLFLLVEDDPELCVLFVEELLELEDLDVEVELPDEAVLDDAEVSDFVDADESLDLDGSVELAEDSFFASDLESFCVSAFLSVVEEVFESDLSSFLVVVDSEDSSWELSAALSDEDSAFFSQPVKSAADRIMVIIKGIALAIYFRFIVLSPICW